MEDIIRQLERVIECLHAKNSNVRSPEASMSAPLSAEEELRVALRLSRERKLRNKFVVHEALLSEPSWDLLVDLFIKKTKGEQVSIKSACIASGVPPTTALRWIAILAEAGLLTKTPDEHDGRRSFLTLTESGSDLMRRYLSAMAREIAR